MQNNIPIDILIESVLFHRSEPIKINELAKILSTSSQEVMRGLDNLKNKLNGRGVILIIKDDQAMLGTSPQSSSIIERLIKADLDKDLGKAGIETLSIVLYKGPISRTDIDYIRGVNSSFILRNLLIRGLIERIAKGKSFYYRPTFELLSFLGITDVSELPDYKPIQSEIEQVTSESRQIEKE